eukprot:m.225736 g.225736  ORF g.225736 m.225736 type:complete len:372 (-) comp19214_c0_seq1:713-1828(-)
MMMVDIEAGESTNNTLKGISQKTLFGFNDSRSGHSSGANTASPPECSSEADFGSSASTLLAAAVLAEEFSRNGGEADQESAQLHMQQDDSDDENSNDSDDDDEDDQVGRLRRPTKGGWAGAGPAGGIPHPASGGGFMSSSLGAGMHSGQGMYHHQPHGHYGFNGGATAPSDAYHQPMHAPGGGAPPHAEYHVLQTSAADGGMHQMHFHGGMGMPAHSNASNGYGSAPMPHYPHHLSQSVPTSFMYHHGAPGMMATASMDNHPLPQRQHGAVNVQHGFHVAPSQAGHSHFADRGDVSDAHSDDNASMESGDGMAAGGKFVGCVRQCKYCSASCAVARLLEVIVLLMPVGTLLHHGCVLWVCVVRWSRCAVWW